MKESKRIEDILSDIRPKNYTLEFTQNDNMTLNKTTVQKALRYLEELGLDYSAPLAIGFGQTIAEPYITRLMYELLELNTNRKVLEVGTGSGHQAAILAELAADVYTIDIVHSLVEQARSIFRSMGYQNIHCKLGNGYEGWSEYAPYDAIIVTVCCKDIPPQLIIQLAENGVLVMPLELENNYQYLWKIVKSGMKLKVENIGRVSFPQLNWIGD